MLVLILFLTGRLSESAVFYHLCIMGVVTQTSRGAVYPQSEEKETFVVTRTRLSLGLNVIVKHFLLLSVLILPTSPTKT